MNEPFFAWVGRWALKGVFAASGAITGGFAVWGALDHAGAWGWVVVPCAVLFSLTAYAVIAVKIDEP